MERKEFLKKTCKACIGITAGWMLTELAACSHTPIYKAEVKDHKAAIPLSMFASSDVLITSIRGLEYDLAIRKEKDNSYSALLLKCTHFDNPLTATGTGYTCSLHGSMFDREGVVTQGPAEYNLKHYPTTVNATDVIIHFD